MNSKTHRIYSKLEGWGYVASCPELTDYKTSKMNGPRAAAEIIADHVYGKGNYTLKRVSFKTYDICSKQGLTHGLQTL